MLGNMWSAKQIISNKAWQQKIKNTNVIFHMQDRYLIKDLGKAYFMILTQNIQRTNN